MGIKRESPKDSLKIVKVILATTILTLFVIYNLFPFIWMLSTSLKTNPEAMSIPITWIPQRLTFQSYIGIWKGYHFTIYFINSVVVASSTALLATFIGALAGYGFSRFKFRGKTFLIGAFLAMQMISGAVIIGPYFKILAKLGLYNTRFGLIIALTTICLPFCVWMTKGYFDTIPPEIDQAAMVDGCSRFQAFLLVISPLAVPGMVATTLFSFLLAWQDLMWAQTLLSTESTRTVTVGLAFFVGQFQINWPMLMAATLVASLPSVLLYAFLQRVLVSGLTAGAVKQ